MQGKQMTRRKFVAMAGTAGGIALLVGCTPTSTVEPTPETATTVTTQQPVATARPTAKQPVTVTAKAWPGSPFETETVLAAIKIFEEANPDIKVDWQTEPQDYAVKVMAEIAAGIPADTFYVGAGDYFTWVTEGVLRDITALKEADPEMGTPEKWWTNYQAERDRCEWIDGKWYALGMNWVLPHLFVNLDLFANAGVEPPSADPDQAWTWDEMVRAAKALTLDDKGRHPDEAGFDPANIVQYGTDGFTRGEVVRAMVGSNGGDYTTPKPDGKFIADSPAAMQAFQEIADLANVHHVAPQTGFLQEIGMDKLTALASGKFAMIADGSWNLLRLEPHGMNLGTGVLPRMKQCFTHISAKLQAMPKNPPHPDEGWRLMRFLSSDTYARLMCKGGLWLPDHVSLSTPEGIASWWNPDVHPKGYEKIAVDYQVQCGHVQYTAPGYPEASSKLLSVLSDVWIGKAKAADVLPDAVAQANKVLDEWRKKY